MIANGQTQGGLTYKGSQFHRIIENFMVQGGDIVNGDGTGSFTVWDGKGGKFADENLEAASHLKGVISMANSGPNTNGCQFFITTVPTPWLDGKHQVFGRVVEGMELVDAISHIQVDDKDHPVLPVTIKNIGEVKATSSPVPSSTPRTTGAATPRTTGAATPRSTGAATPRTATTAASSAPRTVTAASTTSRTTTTATSTPRTTTTASSAPRTTTAGGARPAAPRSPVPAPRPAPVPAPAPVAVPAPAPVPAPAAPALSLESAKLAAGKPTFTRYIYFDLEQADVDLGRVVVGL